MTDFVEKLQIKGKVEEDIYFARRDRELLNALHRRQLATMSDCGGEGGQQAADFETRFQAVTERHKDEPGILLAAYRRLLDEINARRRRR